MKALRPFVTFNFDLRATLTTYQKRKIKKYHDEFNKLSSRSYQVFKPKIKKRLEAAKEYSGQDKRLTGFKAAFVPTPGEKKVKLKFDKNNKLNVISQYSSSHIIELDKYELLRDPLAHVNERIKNDKSNRYTIMADVHEIPNAVDRDLIGVEVAKKVMKYSDESKNDYFGNWLFGIRGHSFKDQETVDEYLREKEKAKQSRRAEKRKAYDKRRYQQNKMRDVITIRCPQCGKFFEVRRDKMGQMVQCPHCKTKFKLN